MFIATNLKKITAIVMAVIGLVVVILGATMMKDVSNYSVNNDNFKYSTSYYNAEDVSFGGDFYTYMYAASNTIVDELDDINFALATVVDAQDAIVTNTAANVKATGDLIEAIGKTGGMITIAIGLAIFSAAVKAAGSAFAPVTPTKKVEEVTNI